MNPADTTEWQMCSLEITSRSFSPSFHRPSQPQSPSHKVSSRWLCSPEPSGSPQPGEHGSGLLCPRFSQSRQHGPTGQLKTGSLASVSTLSCIPYLYQNHSSAISQHSWQARTCHLEQSRLTCQDFATYRYQRGCPSLSHLLCGIN